MTESSLTPLPKRPLLTNRGTACPLTVRLIVRTWDKAHAHGLAKAHHLKGHAHGPAHHNSYDLADGIQVPPKMLPIVSAIAHDFFAQTGRRLTVTSGTRDARRQAKAMSDKLYLGDDLGSLYTNQKALAEITAAWNADATPQANVQAMADVINNQIARGVLISDHLIGEAVDFRNLNAADFTVLQIIVREQGNLWLKHEGKPPHVHLQIQGHRAT